MNRHVSSWAVFALVCWLMMAWGSWLHGAEPVGESIWTLEQPLTFTYGSWSSLKQSSDRRLVVSGVDGKGGAGYNIALDLSGHTDASPAIRLRVGKNNQAAMLRLILRDAHDKDHFYHFSLRGLETDRSLLVTPMEGASLSDPNQVGDKHKDEPSDWSRVVQAQVQGDWRQEKIDVVIEGVLLVAADQAIVDQRRERLARREEAVRERMSNIVAARTRFVRDADAPQVEEVLPVGDKVLMVAIRAGRIPSNPQVRYEPQADDEVRLEGGEAMAWQDGQPVRTREHLLLYRANAKGELKLAGGLTGDRQWLTPIERKMGTALEELLADQCDSYQLIEREGNQGEQTSMQPVLVWRKSKPMNHTEPGREPVMLHRLYLEWPQPLREGSRYELRFSGVNTAQAAVTYVHELRRTRSEAVHVSLVGYRPDDPLKRGYLSLWKGTGGGHRFEGVSRFEVIDQASHETVFSGQVRLAKDLGEPERLKEYKDYTKSQVHHLDFSDLNRPGRYRVFVEGVGCSDPFEISQDVWTNTWRVGLLGLLHHRSGIELGPPLTNYVRPRGFHPDDGVKLFQLRTTSLEGESASVNRELLEANPLPATVNEAWGGYMDAGDWDRRSDHLQVTYLQLELLELFPDYFTDVTLNLPKSERGDALPDLLNEALWNLSFYRRLQTAEGGVRGGVESTGHPRAGECSWQESLLVGVFAPDPLTTFRYAAVAARASRVLRAYDAQEASNYATSAQLAWNWALAHPQLPKDASAWTQTRVLEQRLSAAVELYALTGQADYHQEFLRLSTLGDPEMELMNDRAGDQRDAVFAYARLPETLGQPELRQRAIELTRKLADQTLAFAQSNSFNLAKDRVGLPVIGWVGYFTVPDALTLPRAHYLTGDPRYLAGAIMASNFTNGANPDNMTFTTGLGPRHPENPLHLDSRRTGQPAPAGITVYGPGDPATIPGSSDWMHTWFLSRQMTPDSRSWPAHEFYCDVFLWPEMCEYTVHQTFGPTHYVWGYLAARPPLTLDKP